MEKVNSKYINKIQLPDDASKRLELFNVAMECKDAVFVNAILEAFKEKGIGAAVSKLKKHAADLPIVRLYAIASERMIRRNGIVLWEPEVLHVHAVNDANAKFIFMQYPEHKNHRIVAIGPVIGYHIDDEHGEKLRA